MRNQFRVDVNALRALAVAMVIANHLDEKMVAGGYLGVDIFFAISGFVIYSSIHARSIADGSFDIAGFYARRILRLFPALVVLVLAVSLLVVRFDPDPVTSLRTGLFSLFGLSNLYLYQQDVDYFAPSITANAFMHTWSLGVEEQFYVLLSLMIALPKRLWAGRTTLLFAATAAASFAYWLALALKGDASAAHFLSPARFWEVMAGVLVARLCISRTFRIPLHAFHAVLVALVALAFLPDALGVLGKPLAVALTCTVLATGSAFQRGLVALGPIQFLGDVSYSLYLWHWPVICLAVYMFGFDVIAVPWLLAAMLAGAVFSYYVVERPFRKIDSRKRLLPVLVTTLVVACAAPLALLSLEGQAARLLVRSDVHYTFPPVTEPFGEQGINFFEHCAIDGAARALRADTVARCTVPPAVAGAPTFWLQGDSHAGHHNTGIALLRQKYGFGVHDIETVGAAFPTASSANRLAIHEQIMQKARRGDVVVVARLFVDRGTMAPVGDLDQWIGLLDQFLDTAKSRGIRVIILGPLPIFDFADIRTCKPRGLQQTSCDVERGTLSGMMASIDARLVDLARRHPDVKVVDQFAILCRPAATRCSPFEQGVAMFRDRDHLNSQGSRLVFESIAEDLREFQAKGSAVGSYRVQAAARARVPAFTGAAVASAPAPVRRVALRRDQVSTTIVLDGDPRLDATGQVLEIPVRIANLGTAALSGAMLPAVNVGVKILAHDGTLTSPGGVKDFLRFPLPELARGRSGSMVLRVPMSEPVRGHVLRVDLVQEHVAWFSEWGQLPLDVGPFGSTSGAPAPARGAGR